MTLSQQELLKELNHKSWISTNEIAARINENPCCVVVKLTKLHKFGFIEKKDQDYEFLHRFSGAKPYLWRRLKQVSKSDKNTKWPLKHLNIYKVTHLLTYIMIETKLKLNRNELILLLEKQFNVKISNPKFSSSGFRGDVKLKWKQKKESNSFVRNANMNGNIKEKRSLIKTSHSMFPVLLV